MQPVPFLERRDLARPSPPFERDHVEALALESPQDFPRPLLGRTRCPFGLGHDRLRSQYWMTVAKERIAVGNALVRAARDAQDGFSAPDVRQGERQPVDRDA